MCHTLIKFLRQELSGWEKWELGWLFFSLATIASLSFYWGDSAMGIVSASTGVVAVVCTGKGKRMTYVFGLVNVSLYSILSFESKFYGEVMLNALYFLPMQFYGFYSWTKNCDQSTGVVLMRRMSVKELAIVGGVISASSLLYGFFLAKAGGNLPYLDAVSTVASIVAMVISVKRFAEQWLLWIMVNVVSIAMWGYSFFCLSSDGIATLVMWSIYLVNAIIMYIEWIKPSAKPIA